MKMLAACEYSGRVRDAFAARGWDAWSCDIIPSDAGGQHIQGDIRDVDLQKFDLVVAFPPCTYLCSSGAAWWAGRVKEQEDAVAFVKWLWKSGPERMAFENPVGWLSTAFRPPDQIIQPWQFGHGETKATCLWLRNLPCLRPTNVVEGREQKMHRMSPGPNRSKARALTYQGIADAMAEQWSQPAEMTRALWW